MEGCASIPEAAIATPPTADSRVILQAFSLFLVQLYIFVCKTKVNSVLFSITLSFLWKLNCGSISVYISHDFQAAAADDDDDDVDLFGEETEEEKKAAEERAAAIKASAKKKESKFLTLLIYQYIYHWEFVFSFVYFLNVFVLYSQVASPQFFLMWSHGMMRLIWKSLRNQLEVFRWKVCSGEHVCPFSFCSDVVFFTFYIYCNIHLLLFIAPGYQLVWESTYFF